jgi:hypothetical protein
VRVEYGEATDRGVRDHGIDWHEFAYVWELGRVGCIAEGLSTTIRTIKGFEQGSFVTILREAPMSSYRHL